MSFLPYKITPLKSSPLESCSVSALEQLVRVCVFVLPH